eukprot:GSMAST32.ASY1.ANO1.1600.1 assembled CDS
MDEDTKLDDIAKSGAVQIISIDIENETVELHEEALKTILGRIPEETPVSVISVVGAFRMGKSFMLDLMLRYLKNTSILADNETANETNLSDDEGHTGFSWRSGKDRMTTGIWMWPQHFIRTLSSGKEVAVLLMDTQGMFDGRTSQMLTAAIFGISTLLSSYQIYNVSRQIQEDNLQHLALFAEYGRLALKKSAQENRKEKQKEQKEQNEQNEQNESAPFQRLDFVVRDWQNFEDEDETDEMLQSMPGYLTQMVSAHHNEKALSDLNDTRTQIYACFKNVGCFLLPHPGFAVTRKDYAGNMADIREPFLRMYVVILLMSYYMLKAMFHYFAKQKFFQKQKHFLQRQLKQDLNGIE